MRVIEREGLVDLVERMQFSGDEDGGMIAVFTHIVGIMGDQDHGAVFTFFKEFYTAFLMESAIAYRDDFIDQETVELDCHRNRKRQPGAHAGRIFFYGFAQVGTQFRKFFNIRNRSLYVCTINTAYEPQIIQAGQTALKCN